MQRGPGIYIHVVCRYLSRWRMKVVHGIFVGWPHGGPVGGNVLGEGTAREMFVLVFFFKRNDQISTKLGRNHP